MKSFKEHMDNSIKIEKTEIKEKGVVFKTGQPVEFPYRRGTVKHPNMGSRFQQDIEPTGIYMNFDRQPTEIPDENSEKGLIKFTYPLVIPFNTTPGGGYDENSWKMNVFYKYNKTGKKLSDALKKDGYDGIVTVDLKHKVTSEIIKLI